MSEQTIYQIKITLDDIRPPIWRRVQVPGEIRLAELHDVIQVAMAWENCHLHESRAGNNRYAPSVNEEFATALTAGDTDVRLCHAVTREKAKLRYTYDFGDGLRHSLTVEKILEPEAGARYPLCLAGKRACPPEDCGGTWGYAYDDLGRLVSQTAPESLPSVYGYDEASRLVSVPQPGGHCAATPAVDCVTYPYDPARRPTGSDERATKRRYLIHLCSSRRKTQSQHRWSRNH